eukprot:7876557-Ditylum_brightwellii.AAC.1
MAFTAMDGLKLYLHQSSDHEIQNSFYNGWYHDHYVTSIFLFTPDGMICSMLLNVLGCMHDCTKENYGFIHDKLDSLYHRQTQNQHHSIKYCLTSKQLLQDNFQNGGSGASKAPSPGLS